jgi:Raf kinase inhibitor-like YbhB/YbcL family protein
MLRLCGKVSTEKVPMEQQSRHKNFYRIRGLLIVTALMFTSLVLMDVNLLHAEENMALTLKSSAFDNGGEIPSRYTCEGEDISPPLVWTDVPETARSLVLIIDDPDAPDPKAPKMIWVHWVLFNIPPDVSGLQEAIVQTKLPPGMVEGLNDWKRIGYGGPCPPIGRHRYFHKLYALDTVLEGMNTPTKTKIEAAMKGHIIAQTELMGTYQK